MIVAIDNNILVNLVSDRAIYNNLETFLHQNNAILLIPTPVIAEFTAHDFNKRRIQLLAYEHSKVLTGILDKKASLITGELAFKLGFVGRNAERVKQNDAGVLSDSEYGWSAGIDAVGTVGAMIIGNRVGTAVEARYGAGFYAMASEAVTFAIVDTYAQSLIYKVTDGKTGTGNSSEAFVNSVSMDMIVGAGLHLASRLNFGAKVLWKMPTEGNTFEDKIVMPTSRADIEAKYLFTKADSTGRSLILGDGGKYTSAISGKEIELPKSSVQASKDATEWLVKQAPEMKAMMDKIKKDNPAMSSEDLSIIAVNIRNAFVNTARQSIADPRVFTKLEGEKPLWDYKVKEAELAAEGYSGRELHDKLMKDAFDVDLLTKETKYVGCFVSGTIINTNVGYIQIQDIKVGDLVLSSPEFGDGTQKEYKKVVNLFNAKAENIWQLSIGCYKTIIETGLYQDIKEFIYLTERHPVYVVESEFNPDRANQWIAASELIPGEIIFLTTQEGDEYFEISGIKPVREIEKNIGFCENQDAPGDMDSFVKFNDDSTYETIGFWNSTPTDTIFKGNFKNFDKNDEYLEELLGKNISAKILTMPVFNIEVEDYHTYFVGELGLWVHNNNECSGHEPVPALLHKPSL